MMRARMDRVLHGNRFGQRPGEIRGESVLQVDAAQSFRSGLGRDPSYYVIAIPDSDAGGPLLVQPSHAIR
jgi:hypothetical protein